jgi:hypothetical protein
MMELSYRRHRFPPVVIQHRPSTAACSRWMTLAACCRTSWSRSNAQRFDDFQHVVALLRPERLETQSWRIKSLTPPRARIRRG